jgi:hypothetical protein
MTKIGHGVIPPAEFEKNIKHQYQNREQKLDNGNVILYTMCLMDLSALPGLRQTTLQHATVNAPVESTYTYIYLQIDTFDNNHQLLTTEQDLLTLIDPHEYIVEVQETISGMPRFEIEQLKKRKKPIIPGPIVTAFVGSGIYCQIDEMVVLLGSQQVTGSLFPESILKYSHEQRYYILGYAGVATELATPKTKLLGWSETIEKLID